MIGEIRLFAGNFAPRHWALCDGQLLSVEKNQSLFSILGTSFGGDGRTNFALPDLRGRIPVHAGTGSGLTTRKIGQKSGTETNTMTVNQMPSHSHSTIVGGKVSMPVNIESDNNSTDNSEGAFLSSQNNDHYACSPTDGAEAGELNNGINVKVEHAGSSLPTNNMQPYTVVNYIIALQGVYPSRS